MKHLVHPVIVFCVFVCLTGLEDYWNDDFDETKNCKDEDVIAELFSNGSDYCARQIEGKKMEMLKAKY